MQRMARVQKRRCITTVSNSLNSVETFSGKFYSQERRLVIVFKGLCNISTKLGKLRIKRQGVFKEKVMQC